MVDTDISYEDIDNRFSFHPAEDETIRHQHAAVREECRLLARTLKVMLPPVREKSLAVTKLEEVMYWANAAIARQRRE
jgi:hypothetical protein